MSWSVFERICAGITCNYVCFPNLVWFMDFQLQAMPAFRTHSLYDRGNEVIR